MILSMSHNHAHDHKNYNKAFTIGVLLNVAFIIIEHTTIQIEMSNLKTLKHDPNCQ